MQQNLLVPGPQMRTSKQIIVDIREFESYDHRRYRTICHALESLNVGDNLKFICPPGRSGRDLRSAQYRAQKKFGMQLICVDMYSELPEWWRVK